MEDEIFPSIAYRAIVVSFAEASGVEDGIFPSIAYRAIVVSFTEAPGDGGWNFFLLLRIEQ